MNSLAISYMGMELPSPVIIGACPMTNKFENTRQLINAGAGAIVLPSIFQEQIIHAYLSKSNPIEAAEKSGCCPQQDRYNGGITEYLWTIRQMKQTYAVPIIASIHGASTGPWLDYAKEIEASGADAIELNWQIGRKDPKESGASIESRMFEWVAAIRSKVAIPIAFKASSQFTNIAAIAYQLQERGAKGLTLFSHRPTWDVDNDRKHWTTSWEFSPIGSIGRTIEGIVATRNEGFSLDIAASGGVRTADDATKTMIAGAKVVMMVSEIYRQGPQAIRSVLNGIQQFLSATPHSSLKDFQQANDVKTNIDHSNRSEMIDPMTSTNHYRDPTPVPHEDHGDGFGHLLLDS